MDLDRRLDQTGHYELAIVDLIESAEPAMRGLALDYLGGYLDTPAGQYRPVPSARKFHRSRARNRWCLGGNRSSKSHGLVHEAFFHLSGLHPWRPINKPAKIWYATKTFELVGEALWPKLEKLVTGSRIPFEVSWISKKDNIPRSIRMYTALGVSQLTYKAFEQGRETFQAADIDLCIFDEQFPQDIYIEATTRIGSGRSLEFCAGMTPIEPQPWLEEKLNGADLPANTEVFNFPLDDNRISEGGFIADDLIDAVIAEWPEEVVATRRQGKWGSYLGSIFTSYSRDVHRVPVDREHLFLPKGMTVQEVIGSIDWGGANPFVFLYGTRIPHMDNAWYIWDEYYWNARKHGARLLSAHADEIKSRCVANNFVLARNYADHDPTDANEFANMGIVSNPADKDVNGGIECVQTYLKVRKDTGRPRLFISERCKNLLRELPIYKWADPTPLQDRATPVKKDDHSVDALRYLLYSDRWYDPAGQVAVASDRPLANDRANRRVF